MQPPSAQTVVEHQRGDISLIRHGFGRLSADGRGHRLAVTGRSAMSDALLVIDGRACVRRARSHATQHCLPTSCKSSAEHLDCAAIENSDVQEQ